MAILTDKDEGFSRENWTHEEDKNVEVGHPGENYGWSKAPD